ncbi:MAG: restriction endonuclease subunit S, partial [Bacteroidales bacterium]|nr:restriction endonuclease subunit S [Bacteroidales bacterium]
ENEKGWEVKKLGEVCEVTSSKRVYQSEWQTSGIPFYRISDFTQLVDNFEFEAKLFISSEKYDELKENNQVPGMGDILVTSRGTLGNCYIVKDTDRFYFQDGMISWLKKIDEHILPLYIVFLFKNHFFRCQIDRFQSGTTVAYLSISMLKKFHLPVPPLSLQQSFAAKIESIEKQKAAINQSIAETQKLFDYTMDKYFGE